MTLEESWSHRPGDVLNNTYEILERISQGGSGEVYRAVNRANEREVAIKVLKTQFASNIRFMDLMRREESVREIVHDAVVRYFDLQKTERGSLFLVMEFIDGPSLEQVMKKGPVPAGMLLKIARRVLEGLRAAHARGVYHRDLSPDNVILRGGDPDRAALIDFGIAKAVGGDAHTVIGHGFAGKYEYAAPEQLDGRVDARSDLYALGATLLAGFFGRHPDFGAGHVEIVKSKSRKPDLSGVPEPLRGLLGRLLEPAPDDRPGSAEEALALFDAQARPAAAPGASAAREAERPNRPRAADISLDAPTEPDRPKAQAERPPGERPRRRGRGRALAAALAAVAILAVGGFLALGPGGDWLERRGWPVADPYEIRIAGQNEAVAVSGHAPGREARRALLDRLSRIGEVRGELVLARGMPHDRWLDTAGDLAEAAAPLADWSVELSGLEGRVEGEAADPAMLSRVRSEVGELAATGPFEIGFAVDLAPQPLPRGRIDEVVAEFRNCGDLAATGGGEVPPGQPVEVRGSVSSAADLRDLEGAVKEIADGRPVRLGVRVLNPAVCVAETLLPASTDGGMEFRLGYGDQPGTAPDNSYRVGENPVLDLLVPADWTDRYVYAFLVDLEGAVFHLLPHIGRPDNRLEDLGTIEDGRRAIRLSYPLDEADGGKLAFEVAPPLGKSMIVAVVSEAELFPSLRPGSESIEAFAEDLGRALHRLDPGRYEIARAILELRS